MYTNYTAGGGRCTGRSPGSQRALREFIYIYIYMYICIHRYYIDIWRVKVDRNPFNAGDGAPAAATALAAHPAHRVRLYI